VTMGSGIGTAVVGKANGVTVAGEGTGRGEETPGEHAPRIRLQKRNARKIPGIKTSISFYTFPVQIHDIHILAQGRSSLGWSISPSYKEDMKSLVNVPSGQQAQLVSVSERLLRKLRQYGLHLGDTLRVLRSAPLGGPLLVEVNGRELALGRSVAENLFVETECESH